MTKIKDEETRPARLITIPKYQRWILSVIAVRSRMRLKFSFMGPLEYWPAKVECFRILAKMEEEPRV